MIFSFPAVIFNFPVVIFGLTVVILYLPMVILWWSSEVVAGNDGRWWLEVAGGGVRMKMVIK